MMKLYFAKTIFFTGLFILIGSASAAENIFDAERDCRAQPTRVGIRYVPTCSFTPQEVTPDKSLSLDIGSDFESGLFKSAIDYHFTCESFRPLSISYDILDGTNTVVNDVVSGSAKGNALKNTVTHSYDALTLRTQSLNGAVGFQAMKPGCKMDITQFVSYPEPEYFSLISRSNIAIDNLLKNLLMIAQPDASYLMSLSALDNGLILFSFLRQQSDEITQFQIDEAVSRLADAKTELSQKCGSDSQAALCTTTIAKTRDFIIAEANINTDKLVELQDYINAEIDWLENGSYSIGSDLQKLQDVSQKITQHLVL